MNRALYLVGPPGVGKSSVMAALIQQWNVLGDAQRLYGYLWGHWLFTKDTGYPRAVMLGRLRDSFAGTDALAMNVNPDAVRWANEAELPWQVLGEGQRLANKAFLSALAARSELTIVHLDADSRTLDARCEVRGSAQNDSWRRGAATKALRVAEWANTAGVRVGVIDAGRPLDVVVDAVRRAARLEDE